MMVNDYMENRKNNCDVIFITDSRFSKIKEMKQL